jgi:hypothetical protein
MAEYRTHQALKGLQEVMEKEGQRRLQLPRLFVLNRRQLDEYQIMTKRQQRVAFALTWGAAIGGFVVLIAGLAMIGALSKGVDPLDKAIAGGLTAIGAALSGYLGKTFYDGFKTATSQLNRYYEEPSLTGRLLAAERILDQMPEPERSERAIELFTSLLTWKEDRRSSPSDKDAQAGTARP